jgi:hypothetical protein
MSTSSDQALLARALEWLKRRFADDRELASFSSLERQTLAADIGVTESELTQIVLQPGDHSDLMDEMIRARGLDPEAVRRALNGARYMEVTCALCLDSGRCRKELASGTAAARCHDFCANAEAIDDLLQQRP